MDCCRRDADQILVCAKARVFSVTTARVRIADLIRASSNLCPSLAPEMAKRFAPIFRKPGFKYVTLDGEGYKSGSMNLVLPIEQITKGS